jgi:mono/diheme cytochrome c family protein
MSAPPDLVLFLGRFHPLFVHLPIGFLIVLAALELLGRRPRFANTRAAVGPILALLVPVSVASAACGWLLSQGGGYDPALLQLHQWTGIGVAAASVVLLGLHRRARTWPYTAGLLASLGLLGVASHCGGSLTHGSDYLIEHAPAPVRRGLGRAAGQKARTGTPGDSRQQPVYEALVQPILKQYCVSCHGPEKAKADLRLDTAEGLAKGSKRGPVAVAGSTNSPLVALLMLPPDHDDRMPPAGKPQPQPDDLALLKWWIESGASLTLKLAEANPAPDLQQIIESRLGTSRRSAP